MKLAKLYEDHWVKYQTQKDITIFTNPKDKQEYDQLVYKNGKLIKGPRRKRK